MKRRIDEEIYDTSVYNVALGKLCFMTLEFGIGRKDVMATSIQHRIGAKYKLLECLSLSTEAGRKILKNLD